MVQAREKLKFTKGQFIFLKLKLQITHPPNPEIKNASGNQYSKIRTSLLHAIVIRISTTITTIVNRIFYLFEQTIKQAGRKVVSTRPHFAHGEAHTGKREQGP